MLTTPLYWKVGCYDGCLQAGLTWTGLDGAGWWPDVTASRDVDALGRIQAGAIHYGGFAGDSRRLFLLSRSC